VPVPSPAAWLLGPEFTLISNTFHRLGAFILVLVVESREALPNPEQGNERIEFILSIRYYICIPVTHTETLLISWLWQMHTQLSSLCSFLCPLLSCAH
jgi:hypothetical protein